MYHLTLNGKGYLHINLYKGETSDKGVRDGFGMQLFPNGCVYVGFWKNNMAHGTGRLMLPDGTYYEGDYKENNIQYGTICYFNGAKYDGAFCGDKSERFSSGTFTFSSGDRFQGKWDQGLVVQGRLYDKNLKALEFFSDDAIVRQYGSKGVIVPRNEKWLYEGGLQEGQQSGQGVLFSTFPQYLYSKFSGDKINGFTKRMRITWGEISEGEFQNSKMVGVWKRMITRGYEILGDVSETKGRVTFPYLSDDYFEGEIDINWKGDDKPHKFSFKKGVYYFKSIFGEYRHIAVNTEIESIFKIKEVLDRGVNFENTFARIRNARPQIIKESADFTQKLLDNEKLFPECIHPLLVNLLSLKFSDLSLQSGHQGKFVGQAIPKADFMAAFGKKDATARPRSTMPDASNTEELKMNWKLQTLKDGSKVFVPVAPSPGQPDKPKENLRATLRSTVNKGGEDVLSKTSKAAPKEATLETGASGQGDGGGDSSLLRNTLVQAPAQNLSSNPLNKSLVMTKANDNPLERSFNANAFVDDRKQTLTTEMMRDFGNVMTVHHLDASIRNVNLRDTKSKKDSIVEEQLALKFGHERRSNNMPPLSPMLPKRPMDFDHNSKSVDRRLTSQSASTQKPGKGGVAKNLKKARTDQGQDGGDERSGDEDNPEDISDNTTYVQRRPQGFFQFLADEEIEFFEGTIIRQQKQGFCKIVYDYGLIKEGVFVDNKMEGEGTILYTHSLMLIGTFRNDLLDGPGLIRLESEVIEAFFRQGEYRSRRVQVRSNGVVIVPEAPLENPEVLKGNMTVYFKNNHRLVCEFDNNDILRNQKCRLYDPFGNLWIGKIVIPKNEQYKHFITLSSVKLKFRLSLDTDGAILKIGTI